MGRQSAAATIVMVSAAVTSPALAQVAIEQRCTDGTEIRFIEITFADVEGSLPCRVTFRPESEDDDSGVVSWRDIDTLEACEAKADQVVDRLTGEGWTCSLRDELPRVEAVELDASDIDERSVDEAEANLPREDLSNGSGDIEAGTAGLGDRRQAFGLAPLGDGEITDPAPAEEEDVPARLVDNPELAKPSDALAFMINSDLDRLDFTLDGILEATVVGYADLNEDDLEDALVLYTYTSPQPAYRQFLAAYIFDGITYQLTATKPVGGDVSATRDARVEAIARGVVHLSMRAYEPGDTACCPSGERHLALKLQNLDLIEIDADIPTR